MKSFLARFRSHQDEKAKVIIEKDFNVKTGKPGGFKPLYKLYNRYFIKSFYGPFFMFVFPVVIYAILGNLMDSKLLFAGVIAMSALSSGLTGMPFSILELKKSVLMKRIGASPVKPFAFTIVIVTYYVFIILLSVCWLMIWALILFQDTTIFGPLGTVVGFFGFLYGNLLNIVLSLSLGFVISSISKSEIQAQAIGMLIYFPSAFLSGQFISINTIAGVEAMNWISRFLPFRYTTMIIVESWNGNFSLPIMRQIPNLDLSVFESNPFLIHKYSMFSFPHLGEITHSYDDPTNGKNFWSDAVTNKINPADLVSALNSAVTKHNWSIVLYDEADHICAYAVPYGVIALSTIFAVRKFTWSAAR